MLVKIGIMVILVVFWNACHYMKMKINIYDYRSIDQWTILVLGGYTQYVSLPLWCIIWIGILIVQTTVSSIIFKWLCPCVKLFNLHLVIFRLLNGLWRI